MDPLPSFVVERKWCIGPYVVPVETRKMELDDVNEVAGGDQDEQEFECLDLKATCTASWIKQPLKVGSMF